MSELRRVGRHTLIYGIGIVASKLVSFIMLPVYTRYLSPSDFGILELLSTTIDVIGMIGGLGLAAGVFKHFAETTDESDRRDLIGTVTIGSSALAAAITLVGLYAAGPLTRLVLGPAVPVVYFRIFFGIYFVQNFTNIALLLVQAEERSQLFVALSVAKLITVLSLTILFVVRLNLGLAGVLLGNIAGNGVLSLALGIFLFRRVGLRFSMEQFRKLSEFGAPVALWMIGSFILTFSDRYFLNHYVGTAEVGIYSLAYKFSFILSAFAVTPFSQIWEPRRFAIAKQPDAQDIYRRMFFYLNVTLFGGSIAITLFIKDFLRIMVGPAFVVAYHVVPLLLVTTIVQQWTGYCNIGLFLKNATKLYGWSALFGVIAALGLNMLLIPRYGMFGAAWATVIAYVVRFVPVYVWSQAKYRIGYPWLKVGTLTVLLAGALLLRQAADGLGLVSSIAVSSVALAIIAAAMYAGLLDRDERATIRRAIRRPVARLIARAA